MRVVWLILLWSLIEIGLFVTVGAWIGVLGTWTVVLGSAVAGVLIIRHQKRMMTEPVVQDLQRLGDALTPAAHSALIFLAGVLLILPGFLTDILGLLLLLPPVREIVIRQLRVRAKTMAEMAGMDSEFEVMSYPRTRPDTIIDLEAEEVTPPPRPHKPSGWTKS